EEGRATVAARRGARDTGNVRRASAACVSSLATLPRHDQRRRTDRGQACGGEAKPRAPAPAPRARIVIERVEEGLHAAEAVVAVVAAAAGRDLPQPCRYRPPPAAQRFADATPNGNRSGRRSAARAFRRPWRMEEGVPEGGGGLGEPGNRRGGRRGPVLVAGTQAAVRPKIGASTRPSLATRTLSGLKSRW